MCMCNALCLEQLQGGQEKLLTNYIDLLFTTIELVSVAHLMQHKEDGNMYVDTFKFSLLLVCLYVHT